MPAEIFKYINSVKTFKCVNTLNTGCGLIPHLEWARALSGISLEWSSAV